MEFEQIIKRLDFLDKQQRENKETLSKLSERLNSLETSVDAVSTQIKPLSKQIAEITPATKRVEQFEEILSRHVIRGERVPRLMVTPDLSRMHR